MACIASQLSQVLPGRLAAFRTAAPVPAPSAVVVPIEEEGESGSAGDADVEDSEGGGGRKLAQARGSAMPRRGRAYYRSAPAPSPASALVNELAEKPLAPLGAPSAARRALLQGGGPLRRPVLPAVVQQAQSVKARAPAPAPSAGADIVEAPAAA